MQFMSIAFGNYGVTGISVLGKAEALECWSEGKADEEKMHACLAKTISTWLAVFVSEEGLKCLLAAKDNTGKFSACNANWASAQVIYLKVYELRISVKI